MSYYAYDTSPMSPRRGDDFAMASAQNYGEPGPASPRVPYGSGYAGDQIAAVGGIPSGTYRAQDGRLVDRFIVPERHAVPDTRVIYSQTTVPEHRVVMEPKTVQVKTPKTIMEPVEYVVQEPRTVMDEKIITVPKIIEEDQIINVPVPRAVQVPVQRMVPRTIMVPITTYVTQYVNDVEQRTIKVPRTVADEKTIHVPRQVLENKTVTVNRPRVVMEDREVTVQETATVTVPRVVPVAQTIQGQRIVETPRVVEYERPQVQPGRYVRSYRSPGVYPSGHFAGSAQPQEGMSPLPRTTLALRFRDTCPLGVCGHVRDGRSFFTPEGDAWGSLLSDGGRCKPSCIWADVQRSDHPSLIGDIEEERWRPGKKLCACQRSTKRAI